MHEPSSFALIAAGLLVIVGFHRLKNRLSLGLPAIMVAAPLSYAGQYERLTSQGWAHWQILAGIAAYTLFAGLLAILCRKAKD